MRHICLNTRAKRRLTRRLSSRPFNRISAPPVREGLTRAMRRAFTRVPRRICRNRSGSSSEAGGLLARLPGRIRTGPWRIGAPCDRRGEAQHPDVPITRRHGQPTAVPGNHAMRDPGSGSLLRRGPPRRSARNRFSPHTGRLLRDPARVRARRRSLGGHGGRVPARAGKPIRHLHPGARILLRGVPVRPLCSTRLPHGHRPRPERAPEAGPRGDRRKEGVRVTGPSRSPARPGSLPFAPGAGPGPRPRAPSGRGSRTPRPP